MILYECNWSDNSFDVMPDHVVLLVPYPATQLQMEEKQFKFIKQLN